MYITQALVGDSLLHQVSHSLLVTLFLTIDLSCTQLHILHSVTRSTFEISILTKMKFTGFASSLALAGFAYSAALPILSDIENTISGVEGTVVNGVVGPVLSTASGVAGSVKREDFAGLGSTVQTIPSIANGAVGIAAGAVGTAESLASGIVGSVEGAVTKRDDLAGLSSTIQAVPSIVNGAVDIAAGAVGTAESLASGVAGSVEGAVAKRDEFAGLGSTIQAVPSIANGVVDIAAGAVGTAESLASNAIYTAERVAGKASGNQRRQLETLAGPIAGSTAAIVGSAVPAVVQGKLPLVFLGLYLT